MIKTEAEIKAEIQLALTKSPSIRLFNIVTGMFWRGEVLDKRTVPGRGLVVTLGNACPVRTGVPGMSDLIGWRTMEIKPEDLGKVFAIFSAIEVKNLKGRGSTEQFAFINKVQRCGGFAGIAKSVHDAQLILEGR